MVSVSFKHIASLKGDRGIPGPMGDVTQAAEEALDEAQSARVAAQLAAQQATDAAMQALGARIVYHGSVASTSRPTASLAPVIWVGTVVPQNIRNGDIYMEAEQAPFEPDVPWDINLNADGLSSYGDGAEIGSWTDSSGAAAFTAPAGYRPILTAATGSAPAYAHFNGSKYLLREFSGPELNGMDTTEVFVIRPLSKPPTSGGARAVMAALENTNRRAFQQYATGTQQKFQYRSNGNQAIPANAVYTADQWMIYVIQHEAGGFVRQRLNGVEVFAGQVGTPPGISGIVLGSSHGLTGQYIGGIGTYKRLAGVPVSEATIAAVERAMAAQYGFAI